jgi:hypothetical protein
MSHWLIRHGHQVSLLVEHGDNWAQNLPPEAQCIVLGDQFRELYYFLHAKRLWRSLGVAAPDVIKSFDIGSSWIACQLAAAMGKECKVIAGMYGAFFFNWYYAVESLPPWSSGRIYLRNFLRCIPASGRLVCGIDQVEDLEGVHGESCILWPTPIDTKVFDHATRRAKWGKIVSVGRMDVMKPYNLYMVDVIQELREKGYDVTWSVYGTGDREQSVRQRIQEKGLDQVIKLEGTVPYRLFWQVLSDAYVFVGMGTSVLEAALFGVPNVVALAYDRIGLTYGPSYVAPSGSMAPSLALPPHLKVADEIERILRLTPENYQIEQERVRSHVQPHEIDKSMNSFLQLVRDAEPFKRRADLYLANYPRWLLHKVVNRLKTERLRGHPEAPLYGTQKTAS